MRPNAQERPNSGSPAAPRQQIRPLAQSLAELQRIASASPVKQLAAAFAAAGQEFALVGGPVRDVLLGRDVLSGEVDLDFTTSARPDQTREILETVASKVWDLGSTFGTLAAKVDGHTIEVTTYRSEIYRDDSRKPEVTFGDSINDDLVRRDFTVNAIALKLPEMRLVDVAGGVEDLLAGRLDTPRLPEQSFSDDPLRMLRAVRFASQLGFTVVPRVREAMEQLAQRLEIVSAERIRDELVKLINCDDPVPGLRLLVDTGLADEFLPELPLLREAQDVHKRHKDVYEHSLTVLRQAIELEKRRRGSDTPPDTVLRLAALLHDIGKPATRRFERGSVTFYHHDVVGAKLAKKRLRQLRFDNETIKQVARLIELHLRFFGYSESEWTDSAVRRYVRDGGEVLDNLHILTRADVTTQNQRKATRLARAYDELEQRIAELAAAEELAAVRPDLNGEQIMEVLGVQAGPAVGAAYKFLLELRLDEGPLGEEAAADKLLAWWETQDQERLTRRSYRN